ncbi:unnamed protein product [Phaedon cochleariae]|uniref:maleylacetoacetate isomerase n=1 Tax=Phaedon cochleariae TaxID=80249 RepID=A0A9P0DNL4_PHACE|nr:unnamed protein product [Phaedon cochleariae]
MAKLLEKPILYGFWASTCTWRVRIALNLKEIPHEIKPVDLSKGAQHSEEYRKFNPMEQVPALVIDGATLVESMSILQYLEETRPQKPLLPKDALKRAKVREICEIVVAGIQPLQNLVVQDRLNEDQKKDWVKFWIERGFTAVEKLLSSSAGKFCVGDEITLADCVLVPQVSKGRDFKVDMEKFPRIERISKELVGHPAFVAAHPKNQPDFPTRTENKE